MVPSDQHRWYPPCYPLFNTGGTSLLPLSDTFNSFDEKGESRINDLNVIIVRARLKPRSPPMIKLINVINVVDVPGRESGRKPINVINVQDPAKTPLSSDDKLRRCH